MKTLVPINNAVIRLTPEQKVNALIKTPISTKLVTNTTLVRK